MLNQKIIKNILCLISLSFLYNFTVYGSDEGPAREVEVQEKPYYKTVPTLPNEMLVYIFEIGQKDRSVLKKLRVVCKPFCDRATKLGAFFYWLDSEDLQYYKRRFYPYASVRIHADILKKAYFVEENSNTWVGVKTLVLLNPRAGEADELSLVGLTSLINLENLTVRNRTFKDSGFQPLTLLTNLTSLDLSGAVFHEFNSEVYLTKLFKLNRLVLMGHAGEETTFGNISQLTNLTQVNVWRSGLPVNKVKDILKLTQLRKLNIDGNMDEIETFERIEHFTRLTKLEMLSLDGDVAMAYKNFILSLINLKKFIIDGTTCDPKEVFSPSLMSKSATM
mgnify:FL=1